MAIQKVIPNQIQKGAIETYREYLDEVSNLNVRKVEKHPKVQVENKGFKIDTKA